jgi:uncharacterized protein YjbI with pentapeptide repeats
VSSLFMAAVGFVAFGVFIALAYRQQWHWTGLPAPREEDEGGSGQSAKTLWDWLQLLGIPVALAALAFLLNNAHTQRDQEHEDQRATQQQQSGLDAKRENTLRAYLAQMSELMLHDDLLHSNLRADVRNVARTATLTAVRRLDGPRRGLVVQFLFESKLLAFRQDSLHAPVVVLRRANLSGANLSQANLFGASLSGANLSGANLSQAFLRRANLRDANLRDANLSVADLRQANLSQANLRDANLSRAALIGAELIVAELSGADLRQARLFGAELIAARLRGADLRQAGLSGADLRQAGLSGADLRQANLSWANLSWANLRGANLRGANLRRADFRGAALRGAALRGADLRGARHAELADTRGTPAHGP